MYWATMFCLRVADGSGLSAAYFQLLASDSFNRWQGSITQPVDTEIFALYVNVGLQDLTLAPVKNDDLRAALICS
jgi:hypothetical protein